MTSRVSGKVEAGLLRRRIWPVSLVESGPLSYIGHVASLVLKSSEYVQVDKTIGRAIAQRLWFNHLSEQRYAFSCTDATAYESQHCVADINGQILHSVRPKCDRNGSHTNTREA
eukprot:3254802-Amphidinium_carterae.1